MMQFMLLLILVEVTFKEIHANHLIWFYPLFAYIAAKHRGKLIDVPLIFVKNKLLRQPT